MTEFPDYLRTVVSRRPEANLTLWKTAGVSAAFALGLGAYLLDKGVPLTFAPERWAIAGLVFLYVLRPLLDLLMAGLRPVAVLRPQPWQHELITKTIRTYGFPLGFWLATLSRVAGYGGLLIAAWVVPVSTWVRWFLTVAFGWPALTYLLTRFNFNSLLASATGVMGNYQHQWTRALRGESTVSAGALGVIQLPAMYPTGRGFRAMAWVRRVIVSAWWGAVAYSVWQLWTVPHGTGLGVSDSWVIVALLALASYHIAAVIAFDRSLELLEQIRYELVAGNIDPRKARDYHDAVEGLRHHMLFPAKLRAGTFYHIPLPSDEQSPSSAVSTSVSDHPPAPE